jgi:hypothetical protein
MLDFMRTLYQNILDRDPEDQHAQEYHTGNTYARGLAHTIGCLFSTPEYQAKAMSTEATVDKFYRSVLGRRPDASERADYVERIRLGMSLLNVAQSFIASEEY